MPWRSFSSCWCGWSFRQCLGQKCILRLLDSYPIQIFHLDLTIEDHTLVLNVELIGFFLKNECYPKFILMGINLHVDRRIGFKRLQSMANNQTIRWVLSKHCYFHTFWNINHKIRRLEWFVLIRGFLSRWQSCLYI